MTTATATRYRWDFDLSNSCQCRICDACGMGTESESCDECQGETRATDDCDGFCYDYKLEWLDEMVQEWSKNVGRDYLVIHGSAMGWQRLSGHTDPIEATGKALLKALTFSGEWSLQFRLDENNLMTIRRSSHDEPTGASFYVTPAEYNSEEE